jgi:hypothetical protein
MLTLGGHAALPSDIVINTFKAAGPLQNPDIRCVSDASIDDVIFKGMDQPHLAPGCLSKRGAMANMRSIILGAVQSCETGLSSSTPRLSAPSGSQTQVPAIAGSNSWSPHISRHDAPAPEDKDAESEEAQDTPTAAAWRSLALYGGK